MIEKNDQNPITLCHTFTGIHLVVVVEEDRKVAATTAKMEPKGQNKKATFDVRGVLAVIPNVGHFLSCFKEPTSQKLSTGP